MEIFSILELRVYIINLIILDEAAIILKSIIDILLIKSCSLFYNNKNYLI
jgi:hypothetical protein